MRGHHRSEPPAGRDGLSYLCPRVRTASRGRDELGEVHSQPSEQRTSGRLQVSEHAFRHAHGCDLRADRSEAAGRVSREQSDWSSEFKAPLLPSPAPLFMLGLMKTLALLALF